ncbi:MAG: hypothetical protein NT076_05710 [Candidatus Pacearchaeota archaeon]|nr:hypothetical protein [Candidatus Pacearchaeota archaeon]
MPILNLMRYEPPITQLKRDGDMVRVLHDLRNSLLQIDGALPRDLKLHHVVTIIDRDKTRGYQHTLEVAMGVEGARVQNNIDLSQVAGLLTSYRTSSEGGCVSCSHQASAKPFPDEIVSYCELYETQEKVSYKTGFSPRTAQYAKKGCDDRKPIFRPLAELLGDL